MSSKPRARSASVGARPWIRQNILCLLGIVPIVVLGLWATAAPASPRPDLLTPGTSSGYGTLFKPGSKLCKRKKSKKKVIQCFRMHIICGDSREPPKQPGPGCPPVTLTRNCPTGVVNGSTPVTLSGTATVGTKVLLSYNEATYEGTEIGNSTSGRQVILDPSADGTWSHTFTPGVYGPIDNHSGGTYLAPSWDEHVAVLSYWPKADSAGARNDCDWTVSNI